MAGQCVEANECQGNRDAVRGNPRGGALHPSALTHVAKVDNKQTQQTWTRRDTTAHSSRGKAAGRASTTERSEGVSNQLKTRLGKTSPECYTPKWVFDKLQTTFDLDVAAPDQPTHVPATNKYTQQTDGLTSPWFGNVWMNPPFGQPKPWVHKFMRHAHGIALLPTSTGRWQIELWQDPRNKWVALPPMVFDGFNRPLPTRCFLVAYGQNNIEAINRFGTVR